MSNPTLAELLAWMDGKSRTFGWSAIVAYDRLKTNQLLDQLFIERFGSGSYLPPVTDTITYGEASSITEHLFDLTFSVPQLSFENADLVDSRAQLALDFVGGMIVTEYSASGTPPRIDKVQRVLPLNRPQLLMSLPLGQGQGNVDNKGAVTLDISKGDRFRATFVVSTLDQEEIGSRFKIYFETNLDDDQRVYPLGKLEGENGVLTPEAFDIRTMPAPGATVRGAKNFGDGAVITFVKLRDGTSSGFPTLGSDFMYPIPADEDGKHYSGCLWLSSHTLFEKVFRPHVQEDLGPEIVFKTYDDGHDVAWTLKGESGVLQFKGFQYDYTSKGEHGGRNCHFWCDPTLPFGDVAMPFTVMGAGSSVDVRWAGNTASQFSRLMYGIWPFPDEWARGPLYHEHDFLVRFAIQLDEATGVVSFERTPDNYFNLNITGHEYLPDLGGGDRSIINEHIYAFFQPKVAAYLQSLTTPDIDTFLVRNLLFPGQNVLRLSDAHVPGDLALFGHIDPRLTSFSITPLRPTVEAGQTQQFTMEPHIQGVTWSIRATDEEDVEIGSISGTGLYTAAPAEALVQGYQRVVVSATGTVAGEEVTASALISVVDTTISIAPLFHVYNNPTLLTAETLDGSPPKWSLKNPEHGAKLSVSEGNECVYTAAPQDPTSEEVAYLDKVLVTNQNTGNITEAELMVCNRDPVMKIVVHKDSVPASGELQVQVVGRDGLVNPDEINATCHLLTPELGSISPSGLFREAEGAHGIVVVMILRESFETTFGYLVLPLPLATYGDLIMRINASLLSKPGGLYDEPGTRPQGARP